MSGPHASVQIAGNVLRVDGRTENICLGRTIDLIKLLPSLGWLVMSLFAIPAYASMGWYTPTILSIVSSGIGIAFAYEILMYQRRFKYVVAGDYLLGWQRQKSKLGLAKIIVAAGLLVIFIILTIVLLNTYYAYIQPCDARYPGITNQTEGCPVNLKTVCGSAPCGGMCEGCKDDPDCKRWTTCLMEQESMTKICPPPNDDYVGNATFSCAADGYWMLCTCFITALWLVAVVVTFLRENKAANSATAAVEESIIAQDFRN